MTLSHDDVEELSRTVRELIHEWRVAGRFEPVCDAWLQGYDLEFTHRLAARGLIGVTYPVDLGGGGRSGLARLIITEELLRVGAPVAAHWIADRQIGPALIRYGSTTLKERYVPGIASGEITFCLGMSETESGSDLASVRTTATRDGDGWRLNGSKIWTSHAHRSSHAYVLARSSSSGARHEGLTEFIVDMASDGVTVRPIHDLAGRHHFNQVTFDDVAVPADHVLGEEGKGWQQVTAQLSFERGGMERILSTYPLLAMILDQAAESRHSPDPAAARAVGTTLARLATLRSMAWDVAIAFDRGEAPVREAAMLKDLGTAFERDVLEMARSVLAVEPNPTAGGAAGLLAQGILAAPGFSIRGGTTEVLRTIVARGGHDRDRTDSAADLRSVVDKVLADQGGEPVAPRSPVWQTLTDLGWTGVGVPEEHGGSGGTLHDLAVLAAGLGRHSVSLPVAETALARQLLAGGHATSPTDVVAPALPHDGDTVRVENGRLHGHVARVPWACAADVLVVLAEEANGRPVIVAVRPGAAGLRLTPGRNLAGEPRDDVAFDGVAVQSVATSWTAERARLHLAGLRAAATVGALETALRHTHEHITVREQFGRPLISFQAVAHSFAVMMSDISAARAATATALDALVRDHGAAPRVAAARVVVGHAATQVARRSHQLHGAMGTTREHSLHLATRRLLSWRDEGGSEQYWAETLGRWGMAHGSEVVWDWVTQSREESRWAR